MKIRVLLSLVAVCFSVTAFSQQIGNGTTASMTTMDQALPSGMYFNGTYLYGQIGAPPLLMGADFLISAKDATHNTQIRVNKPEYMTIDGYNRMYYRMSSNSQPASWITVATTRANTFTGNQRINAKLGINTSPTYDLDVNGVIRGKEIRIETMGADFVFDKDYNLPTLTEVKAHIDEYKHLPGIPSATEMQENGVGVSELSTKLLQKVEELTLYTIQQQEQIEKQNCEIEKLKHLLNTKN